MKLVFVGAPALLSGCATAPPTNAKYYQDSTTDVGNHAPDRMSIPLSAGRYDGVVDQQHMQTQADYHFTLGESYALEGNVAQAIEEYKLVLVYDPHSASVHLKLAAEYIKQGLVSESIAQAREALVADPKNEDAHLLLGGLYSAQRSYDAAMTEYQAVISTNPDNFEAPMYVGALLAEQKKLPEAISYFETLAKNPANPNAHLAWFYIGRVRLEESGGKASTKAEAALQKSISLKPSFTDAVLALAQLQQATGRKDQAMHSLVTFQAKYGPNASVAEELSRGYIEAQEYQQAYDQLAIMEAADPEDVGPKLKMAYILIELKKFHEAITRLEAMLAQAPSLDKPRYYLAAVYEEVKDYNAAIRQFKQIPFGSSYYDEAVVHTAYLYKLLNDYPSAIAAIEGGIKTQDDKPQFYALYASLLDDTKQYQKAATMLTTAVQKFPEHAQLRFFLGSMQDRIGNKDATVDSMKQVLKIDHDHVPALNFLAYVYAEKNAHLDDAEKMVRHALELQPGDGYIMDTLGWVLFKRGQVPEAIQTLEAAYKIQPDESVIAEHLADAYYQQQMPERARRLYMRATGMENNATTLEKLRAKISAIDKQIETAGFEDANSRLPASTQPH
jgi:tetratricopeptide (TPR) repeat protein